MKKIFQKFLNIIGSKENKEAGSTPPVKEDQQAPVRPSAPPTAAKSSDQTDETKPRRPRRRRRRKNRRVDTDAAAPRGTTPRRKKEWHVSQFEVPAVEGKSRFHDFDLPDPLMHAISDLGFEYCTPIQAEILPSTLAGKDASGRAQTGTGKTAAFLITIISKLVNHPIPEKRNPGTPRVLILAPTRELVLQISEEARSLIQYCPLKVVAVFGGMDYVKQRKQLASGAVDIVVATPGRLMDFQRQRDLSLKQIEILIIDEADRMLDMGFIPDVRRIIYSTPTKDKRQTLLFSATLTEEVTRLASQWTRDPVSVEIEPEQVAVDTVEQIVYIVTTREKFAVLYNIIVKQDLKRVLVFCNRRDEVARLAERLTRYGINSSELSGDIPQKKRTRRLEDFKAGKIRVLVATDVAGRGIHIEDMDHVFNFSLPRDPENYVHRIGRTGRAGASGTSVSFADEEESFYLPAIEEFIERELRCIEPNAEWLTLPAPPEPSPESKRQRSRPRRGPSGKPGGSPRRGSRPRRGRKPPAKRSR